MPSNYTAVPAGGAQEGASPNPGPNVLPIVELPIDSDAPNAASLYQPLKTTFDFIGWLTSMFSRANTWTAMQTVNGAIGDATAPLAFTGAVTTRKLFLPFTLGTDNIRIYITNTGFEITSNAFWNVSGGDANKWTQDAGDTANKSAKLVFDRTGITLSFQTTGAAAWNDTSWTTDTISLGASSFTLGGFVMGVAAGVLNLLGNVAIDGDLTAHDIAATSIEVNGDLTAHHVIGDTATPAAAKFWSGSVGLGSTGTVTVAGSDFAGTITLNPSSDASAGGKMAVVTFANAYAVAPTVVIGQGDADTSPAWYVFASETTTTTFTLRSNNKPSATAHNVSYIVGG